MIDGSMVVRHNNGKIIVTKWKTNKPEGNGVIITPEEDVEYGNFVNGQMTGKVTKIYAANRIEIDIIRNGESNGRMICVKNYPPVLSHHFCRKKN